MFTLAKAPSPQRKNLVTILFHATKDTFQLCVLCAFAREKLSTVFSISPILAVNLKSQVCISEWFDKLAMSGLISARNGYALSWHTVYI
jgi:hypothetical protein